MQDEIPQGRLEVIKHDSEDQEMLLQGAEFELFNKTLGISCGKQETDQHGKAGFLAKPIGYMDKNGNFCPYDYLVRETKAASGYMLSEKIMEFQSALWYFILHFQFLDFFRIFYGKWNIHRL